jgi:hypothetical protein
MPITRLLALSPFVLRDLVHPFFADIAGKPSLWIPEAWDFVRDLQALVDTFMNLLEVFTLPHMF